MATRFYSTALKIRRPIAVAAACAIGMCPISDLFAKPQQPQSTTQPNSVERLLNEKDHHFSSTRLLDQRGQDSRLAPFQSTQRPQSLTTPQSVSQPAAVPNGPSAHDLLGEFQQVDQNSSVRARVVVESEPVQQSASPQSSWQAPRVDATMAGTQQIPATNTTYEAAQTSYQAPTQQPRQQPQRSMPQVASHNANARLGIHQLQFISMNEFEQEVLATWGKQLKTSSSPDGRYVRVEMPSAGAEKMKMLVDRQTGKISYEGAAALLDNWHELMSSFDRNRQVDRQQGIPVSGAVYSNNASMDLINQVVHMAGYSTQDLQEELPPGTQLPGEQGGNQDDILQGIGLQNPVRITRDPETGALLIFAQSPEDLAKVREAILKLSEQNLANQPKPARISLDNAQSSQIVESLQELYENSYANALGPVQFTAIDNPNSILVVGQPNGIKAVEQLIEQLDVKSDLPPTADFRVFQLQSISANDATTRLRTFFGQAAPTQGEPYPSSPVLIIPDYRSNQVVVRGVEQYLKQAEALLAEIDIDKVANGAVNEVRVVRLKNALAADVAFVLQNAINGQQNSSGQAFAANQGGLGGAGGGFGQQQGGFGGNANQQANEFGSQLAARQLSLLTVGRDGRTIETGITFDVTVTADANSNSLIINAPASSMDLIVELAERLDVLPEAETMIKVFELVHGDAATILTMLQDLFGSGTTGGAQGFGGNQFGGGTSLSNLPVQSASQTNGATLASLRLTTEPRTNSIIASGTAGDLQVIEDLLNRLDARALSQTRPRIYRLSNAPVLDIADAINNYLESRTDRIDADPRTNTGVPAVNRAVIVIPEVNSNSLIVQALPEYLAEVEEIIRALDRRPPMVQVKTMIAQVDLDAIEEFGAELGIQDSLLFDRGTSIAASGALTGVGFPFNASGNPAVNPNNNGFARELLAGQALTNFNVGSTSNTAGYTGFALSAGNESLSVLLRALKDRNCLRILSKPQITTLENLQGRVAVGANIPRLAGTTQTNVGITQDIEFQDVGVILEVTPRVSPDGLITLAINVEKSSVGPVLAGTNSVSIIKTEATSTLLARSGQTVVFSGLIEEEKEHSDRGAPILSDLPGIGPFFGFESDTASRSEILIIMTPELITSDGDVAALNQDAMDRMHWCLSDVAELYGSTGYTGSMTMPQTFETVYPDGAPVETDGPAVIDSRLESPAQTRISQSPTGELEDIHREIVGEAEPAASQPASERPRRGIFSRRR